MADSVNILTPLEQEGTKSVVRAWLKQVGDAVRRDEPLVELETDKVAVEVPSPADGVLAEITLNEGDEAPPGAVLGVLRIGAESTSVIPEGAQRLSGTQEQPAKRRPLGSGFSAGAEPRNDGGITAREQRLSPLVKRLLSERKLSPDAITGTGRDGRITHKNVEAHLALGPPSPSPASLRQAQERPGGDSSGPRRIPHDPMRKSIAAHMVRSVATAPHVTAVFEADFSAVAAHRATHKASYEKAHAPLTYSTYIVRAATEAMKVAPRVNSRWHDDALEMFDDVNIGVGVALGDKGLIVPVVERAQTLSLREVAATLGALTEKARSNRLKPIDVQGGTFTISNHGVSGSLIATPIIINQPQAAILGVGKLEKRVVVRQIDGADAMVIKPMAYVSLTIDHRVLDGHQTNAWLTRFVEALETWPLEDGP
jgi:2-oxoglutarate dehydrogenase E2 component (dihydrolipoamide succinyltransferase)